MPPKRQRRNVPPPSPSPESIEDSPLEESVPEDQANTEENNSQSTPTIDASARRGRGYTRGISLEKNRRHGKLKITIPDNSTGGVDDSAAALSSYIGIVVRAYAPFYVRSWRDVPNEIKEHIRSRVLDEFDLDFGRSEDLRTVNELMATLFRRHKGRCHDHFKKFETLEEAAQSPFQQIKLDDCRKCCDLFASPDYQHLSSTNAQNRSALTVHHRAGSRSFHRLAEKMKRDDPENFSLIHVYAAAHTNEHSEWMDPVAADNYSKMLEMQSTSVESSPSDIDIFTQVLGPQSSMARGLGRSIKHKCSSSSTSSASQINNLTADLEAARRENEYMRSRQQELESLLERQSHLETRLQDQQRDQEERIRSEVQEQVQREMMVQMERVMSLQQNPRGRGKKKK